jgi:hypothetical protein
MVTVNRSAIVVMPAEPFLEWLHGVDASSAELTLEDLRQEPTIYLLPECENEEEVRRYLRDVCVEIFEEQLDGWYRVPSAWPVRRDLETFVRWFEYRFHSMLVDLCNDPLTHEVL